MKKYEFTGETMEFEGHTLKRIRYLTKVNNSTLGGWIESESNLSHDGRCVVLHEAKVFGNARLIEDVWAGDYTIIKDNAQIKGDTIVSGNAIIGADTIISGNSYITGAVKIFFYSSMNDKTTDKSNISGKTSVVGTTTIEATGHIHECYISDQSLYGHLKLEYKNLLEFSAFLNSE